MGIQGRYLGVLYLSLALAACAPRPFVPPPPPVASGTLIAREAARFIGVPYRYGGDSPRGFDCSGLVYYVHRQLGISVPRTAEEQWRYARRTRRALPGDLVFFRPPKYKIHVGIYLGDGRFVHAPATGKRVRIDSLASWRRYYLGTGRFWE
jgi:murein DD-endopeptidase